MGATRQSKHISDEHLAALAKGRTQGAVVRRYLTALEEHRPKRGRKRTPESINKRLDAITRALKKADPLERVHLVQERMNLQSELITIQEFDLAALEDDFVAVARAYGERKQISYAAWREAGVEAAVLKRAGISRAEHPA